MELTTVSRFYTKNICCLSQPKICGAFSSSREKEATENEYIPDFSQLKFLRKGIADARIPLDLNYNAESTIRIESSRLDVDFLCRFLKDNKSPINIFDSSEISLDEIPFVTYGDVLRFIGKIPYQPIDDVYISVSFFRGVIFLHYKYKEPWGISKNPRGAGWGKKFQQLILSDDCNTEPGIESPLIEDQKFFLVQKSDLAKHHLVYATNIEAAMCDNDEILKADMTLDTLKDLEFIFLRISESLKTPWARDKFEKSKSLSCWLMSYLTGVGKTLFGIRDSNGIVTDLRFCHSIEFCTYYKMFWEPQVTMNFCNSFLSFVKTVLSEEVVRRFGKRFDNNDFKDLPKIDLLFEKPAYGNIRLCNRVDEHASIIPDWFVEIFAKE